MESFSDPHAALAALAWQIELGADEAICDSPIDRFDLPDPVPATAANTNRHTATAKQHANGPAPQADDGPDPVALAQAAASQSQNLDALKAALTAFEGCDLKKGARSTVFADGTPDARVMIIGEAPGRDEDRAGRPFVGRAGQLLDKMLAAIGLDRASDVYITNVLPWRPPQNRDPKPEEIALLKPFLDRHIALAKPEVLVLMGNISCRAILGQKGITRLRGQWTKALELPTLPMFHPAYLLRNPPAKREAWADLLTLNAKLKQSA